jgi:CrcB protein
MAPGSREFEMAVRRRCARDTLLRVETAYLFSRFIAHTYSPATTMPDPNDEEEPTPKRESHYNQQRWSLLSDVSSLPLARSRPNSQQLLNDFDLDSGSPDRADNDTIPSPSSPAPVIPYTRSSVSTSRSKGHNRGYSYHGRSRSGLDDAKRLEVISWPDHHPRSSILLHDLSNPRRENAIPRAKTRSHPPSHLLGRLDPPGSQLDITALPSVTSTTNKMDPHSRSKPSPSARQASQIATEVYTVSYLIFFAIWGTLARLGLQALTFYPGAPVVFSELWANVAGTFVMGFLVEDARLFNNEWGVDSLESKVPYPANTPAEDGAEEKARHGKVKKTIPLYIGLATGFCGSFTSFSSFIRDVFLALSNDLKAPVYHLAEANASPTSTAPRNGGYSVMAICATIIVTISTCYAALKVGAHFALLVQRILPSLPFKFTRRFVDPLVVFLGWGFWAGVAFMAIFPPQDEWRSQALFACVFAPFGCLARYYVSLYLNPILPSFPLGTFAVNIFGTAVLGMSYDLQRVPLRFSGMTGGTLLGCQVLQGIEDGFCGALTTVSTWIVELDTLKKKRNRYVYGAASVLGGLALLVVIMGSVRWTVGWQSVICLT